VAAQVPELNIVVATGCYTYDDVPFFFHHRGPGVGKPDPMVDLFEGDITEGIAGTGVKAGLLKCAIDHQGLTPGVERVMRAVAQTHLRTGTPITVHTHPGSRSGLVVKRIMCDEEGVDPSKVVLGHTGDSSDAEHLTELAEAGFVLGMDRFGINVGTTFEARADIVVRLCQRGYAGSMVLSQDAACYIDWIDPGVRPLMNQWHYLHIHNDVLPYLRDHGVTEEQITTMLVDVPARYFATKG
jgi:phosphotriesterase-related protein